MLNHLNCIFLKTCNAVTIRLYSAVQSLLRSTYTDDVTSAVFHGNLVDLTLLNVSLH